MTRPGRRVVAVFTGGTISMVLDPESGAARPALSGHEIVARVPELASAAEIGVEEFGRYPGPHMDPGRMLLLARRLEDLLAEPRTAGAVIAHGTDTLEETAFLLDLVHRVDRPVVLTGAMKAASERLWDGAANLVDACLVAAAPEAAGRGVLVTMDGRIHAAAAVRKVDTESFAAFDSPGAGPVGVVDQGQVRFHSRSRRRAPLEVERLETRVDLVAAAAGVDSRHLAASLDSGARGIVVQALGRGNVPPSMLPGIRMAVQRGVPVVITSRCHTGRVAPRYGYEGGGAGLRDLGCILGGDLPAPKARILLMVLLGAGAGLEAMRAAFDRG